MNQLKVNKTWRLLNLMQMPPLVMLQSPVSQNKKLNLNHKMVARSFLITVWGAVFVSMDSLTYPVAMISLSELVMTAQDQPRHQQIFATKTLQVIII